MLEEFYTAQEVADIFKINIITVYRCISSGKLKTYTIGKGFRADKTEFTNFLESVKTK